MLDLRTSGIFGERVGEELTALPVSMLAWQDFIATHPEGVVLTDDTGFDRPYGRNPYNSYQDRDDPVDGYFTGDVDPALPAYERVIGIDVAGETIAIRLSDLVDSAGRRSRSGSETG